MVLVILFFCQLPSDERVVWIVSTAQLLAWVQNPVPVSQLDSVAALKCSSPEVNQAICDGIPANEQGLLDYCAFPDFPFYTCVCAEVLVSIAHFLIMS